MARARVDGAAELAVTLRNLGRQATRQRLQKDALDVAIEPTFQAIKSSDRFSDDTGKLRASIKKIDSRNAAGVQMGGGGAFYAPWVEFGHGKTRPGRGRNAGRGGARETKPRLIMTLEWAKRTRRMVSDFSSEFGDRVADYVRRRTL